MVRIENLAQVYRFQKDRLCIEKGIELIDAGQIVRLG